MMRRLQKILFLVALLCAYRTSAQISSGGTPYTLGSDFENAYSKELKSLDTYKLPHLDMEEVFKEDEQAINFRRFAKARVLNLTMQNSGKWIRLDNGDRIWRIKIASKGALELRPLFSQFYIPEGAKMFVYDGKHQQILGAFTSKNNKKSGKFATMFVKGDIMTVEYYEPKAVQGKGIIDIWRIDHAYRNMTPPNNQNNFEKKGDNFGSSGACNININCSLGSSWQNEKRGIARIIVTTAGGTGSCTGSLINNTQEDNQPLFLTANHCAGGTTQAFVDTWGFVFNYESPTCSNPSSEPSTAQSIIGATILANNSNSDFFLVELSANVPTSYNAYFNGWNRSGNNESNTVGIHHPSGDIKKICRDINATTTTDYLSNTPSASQSHFRVVWDDGTTEGGSSGSPLFNASGQIIGQLEGGFAACSATSEPDWYGKVAVSWTGGSTASTRLSDWLDPTGMGVMSLNGKENQQFVNDVSIQSISVPACEHSESTPVEIIVSNNGTANQSNVRVDYELRRADNSLVESGTENIPTLSANTNSTLSLNLDLSNPEQYTLSAEAKLSSGIADQNPTNNLSIENFTTNLVISDFPYIESFENGSNGWTTGGIQNEWELGRPSDTDISSASGGLNAWVTDLDGNYSNNSSSYLLSPVFNLTGLVNGQFSADIFVNTEEDWDGVQLQASTDCGQTWRRVGDVGTGMNWYNNSDETLPFGDFGNSAWSGEANNWQSVSHSLSAFNGASKLQLRFLFRSDASETREGFAVDNVRIDITTGTESALYQSAKIYPNPATDYFILDIDKNLSLGNNLKVDVYTIKGKLISQETLALSEDKYSFDTSSFESGTYILEIATSKGTITKRLIIQ